MLKDELEKKNSIKNCSVRRQPQNKISKHTTI
jgi:hypothetical protein